MRADARPARDAGASLLSPAARAEGAGPRVFATPDEAVRALIETVKANDLDAAWSPSSARRAGPRRHLRRRHGPAEPRGVRGGGRPRAGGSATLGPDRKELVLGNEAWPFPVPLVKGAAGWSFDAAAGREEVLNRRIGRNELAVIRVLHDYVAAQRAYAATGHDGKPAGRYARRFGSDPGRRTGSTGRPGAASRAARSAILVAQASRGGLHGAGRRGAVPVPRLLLPHPRGPGARPRRAAPPSTS